MPTECMAKSVKLRKVPAVRRSRSTPAANGKRAVVRDDIGAPLEKTDPGSLQSRVESGKSKREYTDARMRGLAKVQQQCLLAAAAQNIKKIALVMTRNADKMPSSAVQTLLLA